MEIKTGFDKGIELMRGKKVSVDYTFQKDGMLAEYEGHNTGEHIFTIATVLFTTVVNDKDIFIQALGAENAIQLQKSLALLVDKFGAQMHQFSQLTNPNDPCTGSGGTFGLGKPFRF